VGWHLVSVPLPRLWLGALPLRLVALRFLRLATVLRMPALSLSLVAVLTKVPLAM
jgi:hypothetical protein